MLAAFNNAAAPALKVAARPAGRRFTQGGAIASNLQDQSGEWSRADFTGAGSVVTRKGESAYAAKKSGDWLVVKYPNGDYGYFFKKVR